MVQEPETSYWFAPPQRSPFIYPLVYITIAGTLDSIRGALDLPPIVNCYTQNFLGFRHERVTFQN